MRKGTSLVVSLAAAAVLLALGFAAYLWWGDGRAEAGLLRPGHAPTVRLGESLYMDQCAACHGVDLEGETPDWQVRDADGYLPAPPHDETGHTWHHPDQLLFDMTKFGIAEAANLPDYATRMPAYEGILEDEEIIAILSFIKSRWPAPVRQYQDDINRRFQEQTR